MIILRILANRIPDNWEPSTVWYLFLIETIIEAFLLRLLYWLIQMN